MRGKSNFTIHNTTIKGAIETILGSSAPAKIEVHYGVIEISLRMVPKKKSVFDSVIPDWRAQRGTVQLVSWLLHIQLVGKLNPQIKGFGGDSPGGDVRDEVGPFDETNQPVRRLLDKIVAQSTGAAWIALIPPGTSGISLLAEGHGAWAIVEYHGPSMDFTGAVNALATQLH